MPFNQAKNKMAPNKSAGTKANSKTAGPNGSFPIGDAKHARLAVGAAQRSANAGNISPSTANSIKAKARAALKCTSCKKTGFGNFCQHCGGPMS
jgi:hypothetical protein